MVEPKRHEVGFSELPYELRQLLYLEYFLDALEQDSETELYDLGLMHTVRQVNHEAARAAHSALDVTLPGVRADCACAQQIASDAAASIHAARDDADAGRIPWSEFLGLLELSDGTESESLVKVRRLNRTIKLLEKRSKRPTKTAAMAPKESRGGEVEILETSYCAGFQWSTLLPLDMERAR